MQRSKSVSSIKMTNVKEVEAIRIWSQPTVAIQTLL